MYRAGGTTSALPRPIPEAKPDRLLLGGPAGKRRDSAEDEARGSRPAGDWLEGGSCTRALAPTRGVRHGFGAAAVKEPLVDVHSSRNPVVEHVGCQESSNRFPLTSASYITSRVQPRRSLPRSLLAAAA